jgi:hypothetical protein
MHQNALEISRCDLQHGFWWVSQSILTLHTCFCGNNLLHCSFLVGKGKGKTLVTHDFLRTIFFLVKVKVTLLTHAFLRTMFFSVIAKATLVIHASLRTFFFLLKGKVTLVTHAFLRAIFFHCSFSVGKVKDDTHDPCFPENNFFPLFIFSR